MIPEIKLAIMKLLIHLWEERLTCFDYKVLTLYIFAWSLLCNWPYNKLLVTIYSSKRVNTKTNTLIAVIGFYEHFTRRRFQFIHDELEWIIYWRFDSWLNFQTFCKQQEGFQRAYVKKKSKSCNVNLLVSQNAGFKLFNAWSSWYKKQVKNPRLWA